MRLFSWLADPAMANAFSGLTALATLALAVYTFRLVYQAKDTSRRELRAYIADVSGEASMSTNADGRSAQLQVTLRIKNSGQTPAYNVQIYCDGPQIESATSNPFRQHFHFAPLKTTIGAGSEFEFTKRKMDVTQMNQSDLGQNISAVFVGGMVEYVDAFGMAYKFIFRCMFLYEKGALKLMSSAFGNDAE